MDSLSAALSMTKRLAYQTVEHVPALSVSSTMHSLKLKDWTFLSSPVSVLVDRLTDT